jgi:hypothetical protein
MHYTFNINVKSKILGFKKSFFGFFFGNFFLRLLIWCVFFLPLSMWMFHLFDCINIEAEILVKWVLRFNNYFLCFVISAE